MTPMFSIITPTLQRESLVQCCESVNNQTLSEGWQHIVIADVEELDDSLIRRIEHPQRIIVKCPYPHRNWANTCRYDAWEHASGMYLVHCDDDNTLFDSRILEDMAEALASSDYPKFAIFPIFRHGYVFFSDPPRLCYTDTGNLVPQRKIGRWLNIPDATSDGILGEQLAAEYGATGFPNFRPIITMPCSSVGRGVKEGEGMQ
jgi:glycosyltransferase involved in cell wall biosynthesis